jgi:hypothetical protein
MLNAARCVLPPLVLSNPARLALIVKAERRRKGLSALQRCQARADSLAGHHRQVGENHHPSPSFRGGGVGQHVQRADARALHQHALQHFSKWLSALRERQWHRNALAICALSLDRSALCSSAPSDWQAHRAAHQIARWSAATSPGPQGGSASRCNYPPRHRTLTDDDQGNCRTPREE